MLCPSHSLNRAHLPKKREREMARNLMTSCNHADHEEFIDLEVNSSTTYLCYSISSPPSSREFEFQMSSASLEKEPITSPADELFYQGKLLPLHLPPRLQMVQKLLQNSNNNSPKATNSIISTPNTDIPFESPYITLTPCSSSQLRSNSISDDHTINKYSWPKKIKLIKRSTLASKLKASRAYLKSLFRKSGCSDQAYAQPPKNNGGEETASKAKERLNKYMKVAKQHPLIGQLQREIEDTTSTCSSNRRSFSSGAKKIHSGIKSSSFSSLSISPSSSSSSSSSSLSLSGGSSNGFLSEVHLLRRSNSTNSEIETAIQGAIAHCKQSSGILVKKECFNEVGFR